MKTHLLTILLFLFTSKLVSAQDASLLVQSPDGKTVKIIWFLKSRGNDIAGFDIKRKDGLQDWVKLNTEPILPGISAKKKLSAVESDKVKESMIKAKLLKLLAGHKLQEMDYSAYLRSSDSALQQLSGMMAHDYDIALMSGFGYVDHTATKKTGYQYGLFIHGTDKLLAKTAWNYGEIPDLNLITEITSKATTKSKGITVIWNADTGKMYAAHVAGFNIYREGIRLNSIPVVSQNNKDRSEFTWSDKPASGKIPTQYAISAESIFGIEGIIRPYTYDPADHPDEYKIAEVAQINSLGYYFKDGINVKWNFPKEFERFIKGFYVEKDNMPGGYTRVSGLLEPAARTFIDKTTSPVTAYIRFRVIAVYTDKTEAPGTAKIYSYFPVREPPPPQNVKAKSAYQDEKIMVSLTWDMPFYGDTVTDYYRVYGNDPISNKFTLLTPNEQVRGNKYTYTALYDSAAVYKFCISSISTNKTESPVSDTVFVPAGSKEPILSK